MRVLILAPDLFGYGGVQVAGRMVVRALCESFPGVELTVLSSMDSRDAVRKAYGIRGWGAGGNRKKMAIRCAYELNLHRWDAVLVLHVNLATLLLASFRRQPALVALYGIDAWRTLGPATRRGMRRSAFAWAISEHTLRKGCEFNPWLAEVPAEVCHLGAPAAEDSPFGPPPESNPYILSIGRMQSLERYKGFDELIAVWPRLRVVRPDLDLLLMGDGPDRARLEALAQGNGAGIRFLGRVDDVERNHYLRHCAAFALPSSGEGFGLVYLEAMRVGRPVLTGSTDAGAEVIRDRVTGRAVDPRSSDELLDGLLDVTGPNAEPYGRAGRTLFDAQFTLGHFRDRFSHLIRRLLESSQK